MITCFWNRFNLFSGVGIRRSNFRTMKQSKLFSTEYQSFWSSATQSYSHFPFSVWSSSIKFSWLCINVLQKASNTPLAHNVILAEDKKSILASRIFLQVFGHCVVLYYGLRLTIISEHGRISSPKNSPKLFLQQFRNNYFGLEGKIIFNFFFFLSSLTLTLKLREMN